MVTMMVMVSTVNMLGTEQCTSQNEDPLYIELVGLEDHDDSGDGHFIDSVGPKYGHIMVTGPCTPFSTSKATQNAVRQTQSFHPGMFFQDIARQAKNISSIWFQNTKHKYFRL